MRFTPWSQCLLPISILRGFIGPSPALQYTYEWPAESTGLAVRTNTGIVTGYINNTTPQVRQFLGIPYAIPPVQERRWLPPAPFIEALDVQIDAIRLPQSCSQYAFSHPSIYKHDVHQYLAVKNIDDQHRKTSEDCLTLAIWTPLAARPDANLPVIMFMTGGSFMVGGIDIDYQLPHHWVQRTQSHIVVTINYRLNIFGFPNVKGLDEQNLGILDQRLALEWVRDNIQSFGGDPARITLWGQSAGAFSAEYHSFAFSEDPIASGLFMQSGSAIIDPQFFPSDPMHTNFSHVASQLGCGGLNAIDELNCMRGVDFQEIQHVLKRYADRQIQDPSLAPMLFFPVVDKKIVFENYITQYATGKVSNIPAVFSITLNEALSQSPYPDNPDISGPNQTLTEQLTLAAYTCPIATSTKLRTDKGLLTYRWRYSGNFSNVSPRWWMGAYHTSDLPMLFGSHQDFRGQSTELEFEVSKSMQDHILAFMEDPINGPAKMNWQPTTSGIMLDFGADGKVVQKADQSELDAPCHE